MPKRVGSPTGARVDPGRSAGTVRPERRRWVRLGRWLAVGLVLGAGGAGAEVPPADFFTGRYAAVGRDESEPPRLIDGWIDLAPGGKGLEVSTCDGAGGHLDFVSMFEADNFLAGHIGRWRDVWCLFANDGNNYPMINCATEDGLRLTLWPGVDAGAASRCVTPVGK
jgi:hypothetical protein